MNFTNCRSWGHLGQEQGVRRPEDAPVWLNSQQVVVMSWAMAAADLVVALMAFEGWTWPESTFEPWDEQGCPFGWAVRLVRSVLVGEGMLAFASHLHPFCNSCCSRVPRGLWLFGGGGTCGVGSMLLPYFTGCTILSGIGNCLLLLPLSVRWLVLLAGLACWLRCWLVRAVVVCGWLLRWVAAAWLWLGCGLGSGLQLIRAGHVWLKRMTLSAWHSLRDCVWLAGLLGGCLVASVGGWPWFGRWFGLVVCLCWRWVVWLVVCACGVVPISTLHRSELPGARDRGGRGKDGGARSCEGLD